ncbi:hypothetical protein HDU85_001484 [Gaertneriomyces sp. JEL0708]|nr:hypothetical protein HDU85_001484 [Gaertneriomyces sp. JEL0708]
MLRLVQNNEHRKVLIVKSGVLKHLKRFLSASATHSNDLMYWTLLLAHQLSLSDDIQAQMADEGFIRVFSVVARVTFGNASMQKLSLHSLVGLLSKLNTSEIVSYLHEMADVNVVPLLPTCARNDDVELASWAVFLMHEFITKDVRKDLFYSVKGILTTLAHLLSSEIDCIPRLVLRSLKYLGMKNATFQMDMIAAGIVEKSIPLLKITTGSDPDLPLWTLALLHDLLAHDEAHIPFFESKGLSLLIAAGYNSSVHIALYIADIMVYLSSTAESRAHLETSEVADIILHFCTSDEVELQYAGAALLLNLVAFSEEMMQQITKKGGVETLSALLIHGERDTVHIVAAKALSTMARKDPRLQNSIVVTAVFPLTTVVREGAEQAIHLMFPQYFSRRSEDANFNDAQLPDSSTLPGSAGRKRGTLYNADIGHYEALEKLTYQLVGLAVLFESGLYDTVEQHTLERLLTALLDLAILPLVDGKGVETHPFQSAQMRSPGGSTVRKNSLFRDADNVELSSFAEFRDILAINTLKVIDKALVLEAAQQFLMHEEIFPVMVSLMRLDRINVKEQAMISIAASALIPNLKNAILDVPYSFTGLAKAMMSSNSTILGHYLKCFLEASCDCSSRAFVLSSEDHYARFTAERGTPYISVSPQGSLIRNDSWTFESIKANVGVRHGRYAYEVELFNDGIVQIGWAKGWCVFDPEAGTGVGDNDDSYAIDGHRRKRWHGLSPKDNHFGEAWAEGDIVTALIDMDAGEMAYLLNGEHMGVAFEGVEGVWWYPALSLASGQGCRVYFGHTLDPLRYLPEGYQPIAGIVEGCQTTAVPNVRSQIEKLRIDDAITSTISEIRLPQSTWHFNYFELQVGLRGVTQTTVPHIGVSDREGNYIFLALLPHGQYSVVSVQSRDLDEELFSTDQLRNAILNVTDTESVRILAFWEGPPLQEADIVGCGIDPRAGEILFTFNGHLRGCVLKALEERLYVPYVRNIAKFGLNLGKEQFMWSGGRPFAQ